MNKIKLIAILVSTVGLSAFAFQVYMAGHDIAIQDRFPNVDPDVAKKIHREMTRDALTGKLKTDVDEELDAEFLRRVQEYYS